MKALSVLLVTTMLVLVNHLVFAAEIATDFGTEVTGSEPRIFSAAVGNWIVVEDGGKKLLAVNGSKWAKGQTSAGLADKARTLYGDRYVEFLDNVQAYAYYPISVLNDVQDFNGGTITLRFKGISGRIDQAAGIMFNLKPNGDYLTLRANCLEDNLVLWKYEKGKRSSVQWVKNTPTPSQVWHELKLVVSGNKVEGYLDGKLYVDYALPQPVSGRIGLWSKADSVVYFDSYRVDVQGNP